MSIYIKVDEKSLKIEGVYEDDCKTPIEESKENPPQTAEELMIKASQKGKPFTGLTQIILFAQNPVCVWQLGRIWCF
jgi:hypothetical protein